MATSSAWPQSPFTTGRGRCSRHSAGRLRPVATPALAERYWMSIAMMLLTTTTHTSR